VTHITLHLITVVSQATTLEMKLDLRNSSSMSLMLCFCGFRNRDVALPKSQRTYVPLSSIKIFSTYRYSSQMVYKCLHDHSPVCLPVWAVNAGCSKMQNISISYLLVVPQFLLDNYSRCTFTVACRTTWNLLSDNLWDPDIITVTFWHTLKTFF